MGFDLCVGCDVVGQFPMSAADADVARGSADRDEGRLPAELALGEQLAAVLGFGLERVYLSFLSVEAPLALHGVKSGASLWILRRLISAYSGFSSMPM